jgi:hypothetical protein
MQKQFMLGSKSLCSHLLACKWTEAKAKKTDDAKKKKHEAEYKLHYDVEKVCEKDSSQWKAKDYNVLFTYKKHKGDSPLKKKKEESAEQWKNCENQESPKKPKGYY